MKIVTLATQNCLIVKEIHNSKLIPFTSVFCIFASIISINTLNIGVPEKNSMFAKIKGSGEKWCKNSHCVISKLGLLF